MFARWQRKRADKRKRRRMDGIIDKLVEAGVMAFEEKLRLQVQEKIFDDEDSVRIFVNRLNKATGTQVRGCSAAGLITFYDDNDVDNSSEVVVVMLEQ